MRVGYCPALSSEPQSGEHSPETVPDSAKNAEGASASASEAEASPVSEPGDDPERPKKRRRRRRKGKKKPDEGDVAAEAPTASVPQPPPPPSDPTIAALAGGLLSHIDDRPVPCSVEGCNNVWLWSSAEQIQAFGQPPPKRMCAQCQAIADTEVRCSVESCKRTWTWSRDAQLKHRAWMRRQPGGGTQPRKGRRRKGKPEGAVPRRRCEPCQAKLATLSDREGICKVHACTRPVVIDREAQLRAWAALHTEDLEAETSLPKKMCEVCREFCRTHSDREVRCGRPGCDRTWTYKRGAQLQAFLAGRLEDPLRLCDACAKGDFTVTDAMQTPHLEGGVEVMPCVVPGCDGTWVYRPGMTVAPVSDGEVHPDRMCDAHRLEHHVAGRAELTNDDQTSWSRADDDQGPSTSPDASTNDSHGASTDVSADAESPAPATESPTESSTKQGAVSNPSGS